MTRKLALNAFLHDAGHHEASWRHPDSSAERLTDATWFQEMATKAEAAKMDAVFLADIPAVPFSDGTRLGMNFEPVTLLTAIAAVTSRLGLIATSSTTFNEPYNLARSFASLDQISGGRAGWNIVTTATDRVAGNFGKDMPPASERYERAQEFVDVVTKLWDSWEDGAVQVDRSAGRIWDPAKVHEVNHVGRYFQIKGALTAPRSPQGRPVYVQAGSSNDGRTFAARNAEAIFTAHQTLADAQAFYSDIKAKARTFGRNPDHCLILPGLSPFIGDTEQEANDLYESFNELTIPAYGIHQILNSTGVDLSGFDLDSAIPVELFGGAGDVLNNDRSRRQVIATIVERERPTVRQLLHRLAGGRGHNVVVGTPTQVADLMQAWFEQGGADGFNVMPPLYPQGLDAFTSKVIPILQERGLFRTEYTGSTLREHYGLPRPESLYAGDTLAVSGT